jgi:hypothetical protein
MSWTDVNGRFPIRFGDTKYESLPIAGEFAPTEVHYIWVRLSALQGSEEFSEYLSTLEPFATCMQNGAQSYVTFLFQNNELIRISSRFFDDCPDRQALFVKFIDSLGLSLGFPTNQYNMTIAIGSTNLSWTVGEGVGALDVWKQGSPAPPVDIYNPKQGK